MIDIGENIFYASFSSRKVKSGVVIGYEVNAEGHKCVEIKNDDGTRSQVFCSLTADNAEELNKWLPSWLALDDKIAEIQSQANRQIDEILDTLRGKPQFAHLIETRKKGA